MNRLNRWQDLLYFDRTSVVNILLLSFGRRPNSCLYERKAEFIVGTTRKEVLTLSS